MKEERPFRNVLLFSAMIGLLVLALALDLILQVLVDRNAAMGSMGTTLVWMFPIFHLIWMLGVIGLVWMIISGGIYSRWVSAVYIIIGLIILYINPVLYVNELPDALYIVVQYVSPGTMVFETGGALTAIGLLSLWFWKEPTKEFVEVQTIEVVEIQGVEGGKLDN